MKSFLFTKEMAVIAFMLLLAADLLIFWRVAHPAGAEPMLHFLDVGQGDATLLTFPGGVRMLTDTGPDRKVLAALEVAAPHERRLDLVLVTHPQADHGRALEFLLERYEIGAVLFNGADNPEFGAWKDILEAVRAEDIPLVTLRAGDRIAYGETTIDILSPLPEVMQSAEPNDAAIVQQIRTPGWSALLAADIGFNVEELLRKKYDLRADILKVGHHGSKFSSGASFLSEVRPSVALIGAGEGNRYGHPTKETLERLESAGAAIFRTDENGTITVTLLDDKFSVRMSPKK